MVFTTLLSCVDPSQYFSRYVSTKGKKRKSVEKDVVGGVGESRRRKKTLTVFGTFFFLGVFFFFFFTSVVTFRIKRSEVVK